MRKGFKKFATIGLVGVMAVGAATNVLAASDTISLGGGSADCYLSCGADGAYASTYMYANHAIENVYASVDLQLDALVGSVNYEYVGEDSDYSDVDYGDVAYASVSISEDLSYNIGNSASSSHYAGVDDESGSTYLSEDYYE